MLRQRSFIVMASVVCSIGCTGTMVIGRDYDAGEFDSFSPARPGDSCGNGIDDDEDGRIDDGCPCGPGEIQSCFDGILSERRTGMCSDGVQTCLALGREWGDWGDASCSGTRLPTPQQCTGMDSDCDGAIDEGCPCTSGDARSCGGPLLEGECRSGTQICSGGTWSACVGAVGPQLERCDNGTDDDCDGNVDELCNCVPEAERCHDRIDNDCDGETDEPACTPDWLNDAGVPPDGGVPSCSHTICYGRETSFEEIHRVMYGPSLVTSAFGQGLLAAYAGRYVDQGDGSLRMFAIDTASILFDVTLESELLVVPPDRIDPNTQGVSSIVMFGADVVVQYEIDRDPSPTERDAHVLIGRFDLLGRALSTPVEIGTRTTGGTGHLPGAMVTQGDRIFVAHVSERWNRVAFGEYNLSNNSYAELLTLPGKEITRPEWAMASSGATVAVVTEENRNDVPGIVSQRRSLVTFIRDGSVIATQVIDGGPAVPHTGGSWQKDGDAVIAWGGDRFLVCWARLESYLGDEVHSIQCRAFSEVGTPLTAVFEIVPPVSEISPRDQLLSLAAHGSACSKFFLTNSEYQLIEIDARAATATMAVRRTPLDSTDGTSWTRAVRAAISGISELRTSSASGPDSQNRVWLAELPQTSCP